MLNYFFTSTEEELLHIIRVNSSSYEEYQKIVEKVQNINYTDDNDQSFLHTAVGQRKLDIAIDLMRRGIDVNLQDVNGHTAAQFAVSDRQWEILTEILKYHPNVNLNFGEEDILQKPLNESLNLPFQTIMCIGYPQDA